MVLTTKTRLCQFQTFGLLSHINLYNLETEQKVTITNISNDLLSQPQIIGLIQKCSRAASHCRS